ncbi:MAG: hypothetical protein QM778_04855 [Myxococcales bacterium]
MVMGFLVWFLGMFGVQPTPEDFVRMQRQFSERRHHVTLDFAGQRFDGTRWTGDDFRKVVSYSVGYNYLVDRKYNGVGFEVLGQSVGPLRHPGRKTHEYFLGAGLAWYPIQHLRIFMQAGPRIKQGGHAEALGRIGVGYQIMFFAVAAQPFVYVQTTASGVTSWALGGRIEY